MLFFVYRNRGGLASELKRGYGEGKGFQPYL